MKYVTENFKLFNGLSVFISLHAFSKLGPMQSLLMMFLNQNKNDESMDLSRTQGDSGQREGFLERRVHAKLDNDVFSLSYNIPYFMK